MAAGRVVSDGVPGIAEYCGRKERCMREAGDDVRFSYIWAQAGNVELARVSGL